MNIQVKYSTTVGTERQIQRAIKTLNRVQNHFFYSLSTENDELLSAEEVVWAAFLSSHIKDKGYRIFITEKPFADNWFSHEERNISLISIHSWESFFAPPSLSTYIMYQVAQASINFEADLSEDMVLNLVHFTPKGCMFDFCENKSDIKLGMVSGAICSHCRSALVRYGTSERALSAIESILEAVRAEAIGKPILASSNEAFIVMRFTENDENDHAYRYGIVPALEALGIEKRRGDDQVLPIPILLKVQQDIQRARFIIIKVDSENLNVYYELGYAMGLKKDILLVSEQGFTHNLPTDIRNIECLTYPHGNYEKLKNSIIEFYEKSYHLQRHVQ